MIIHKTKICTVIGANLPEPEELIHTVRTAGNPDFILPAGFAFMWPAVDLAQAHSERKRS